ncbi:MAG TPA: glycosyltransferase [Chitinophagaceae bacterium]|nr:glycosyltransferase [Chitinophagaceae bacterium]
MKQENFKITRDSNVKAPVGEDPVLRKPRILVAPLDWGLGHATRCIPIINGLSALGCDVWLAGEGAQEELLRMEFPGLRFLELPGYRVKYGQSGFALLWNMFVQYPRILKTIRQEHRWLEEKINDYSFDAVISDNRFGLYHANLPCVFITHQLTIKSPLGHWSERLLQKRNYSYINRFNECWIPDVLQEPGLSGELSHPAKKPSVPVRYIGPLSRMERTEGVSTGIDTDLLIILSGPEPQRTLLEEIIINDIAHYPGRATVLRGLPGSLQLIPSTNTIKFYNHLPAAELNMEMNRAGYVISRSGYSTVMDIVKLGKKSIVIPTPGQTEQEYLGHYLHEKKAALCVPQKRFSISLALEAAKSFSYSLPLLNERGLEPVLARFVQSLQKH